MASLAHHDRGQVPVGQLSLPELFDFEPMISGAKMTLSSFLPPQFSHFSPNFSGLSEIECLISFTWPHLRHL